MMFNNDFRLFGDESDVYFWMVVLYYMKSGRSQGITKVSTLTHIAYSKWRIPSPLPLVYAKKCLALICTKTEFG